MAPPGWAGRSARAVLYGLNRASVQLLFHPQVTGREHLPDNGPFILAPNHASSLDPFVLSTALGYRRVRQTCWAGRRGALLENPVRKWVNRLAHAIPIQRNVSALAVGAAALNRGRILVWFPEGHRSDDGRLQPFKRGVGVLLDHFPVSAVPAYIHGAYEAMPRNARLPHSLRKISVAFGPPVHRREFAEVEDRERRIAAMVETLRDRVAELREAITK
jgi:long-chain acyl-CoA synthetase